MAARECRSCIEGAQTPSFSCFWPPHPPPTSFSGLCWKHCLTLEDCELDWDELINVGTQWTAFSPCRLWPFHSGTLLNDYCKHNRPFHIKEELHLVFHVKTLPVVLIVTTFYLPFIYSGLCWLGVLMQGWRKHFLSQFITTLWLSRSPNVAIMCSWLDYLIFVQSLSLLSDHKRKQKYLLFT